MDKTIRLFLNRYSPVPPSLRDGTGAAPLKEIRVPLASLYHHYFLDSHGRGPPNPDPAQFEHVQFLLPADEFRFQGSGLGISPSFRRHRSNELGQAFCRWFLYEHIGLSYFAHIEKLLSRQLFRPFEGCVLERIASGDTPDYLCATSTDDVCLAEAKGRYSSISFKNKAFGEWRKQFGRVQFKDRNGFIRTVKGHIVATRYATEIDSDRLKTTLFAEDPASPGDIPFDADSSSPLAQVVKLAHYSQIALKLRQPVLSVALATGVPMAAELGIVGVAWRVVFGPLQGRRFIGGYFRVDDEEATFRRDAEGRMFCDPPHQLRLDAPSFTFFGVEEAVFRSVVGIARGRFPLASRFETFEQTDFFYSGFSALRDGSVLGPLEFFRPEEQVTL